jgi:hypothetical protein
LTRSPFAGQTINMAGQGDDAPADSLAIHSPLVGASQYRSSLDLMRARAQRISVAIPTPGYAGAGNPARSLSKSAGVFGPHMSFAFCNLLLTRQLAGSFCK